MGAIAKYVDSLTLEKEDRLLTQKLIPFRVSDRDGAGCIVGIAEGLAECGGWMNSSDGRDDAAATAFARPARRPREYGQPPETIIAGFWAHPKMFSVYNQAYFRFGPARLHHAIRMRILNNRARKQLPAPQREAVEVA